jgi:hypothetical protein
MDEAYLEEPGASEFDHLRSSGFKNGISVGILKRNANACLRVCEKLINPNETRDASYPILWLEPIQDRN